VSLLPAAHSSRRKRDSRARARLCGFNASGVTETRTARSHERARRGREVYHRNKGTADSGTYYAAKSNYEAAISRVELYDLSFSLCFPLSLRYLRLPWFLVSFLPFAQYLGPAWAFAG